MKHYSCTPLLILLLWIGFSVNAQSPQGMNYQAVVRNASGQPVSNNTPVSLRFTIHNTTIAGPLVYSEVINTAANAQGLVTVTIGASGNLGIVNWGNGAKFLQIEVDINNTGSYTDMGTSQLMSVPYALYAANSAPGPLGPQGLPGPTGTQGVPGPAGPNGLTGPQGATGATGAQGMAGISGVDGIQGNTGPTGAQGDIGPQGIAGDAGDTGPQGIQGIQGVQGTTGAMGDTGPQGLQGQQGIHGLQGATGHQGDTGIQGIIGATGNTGPQGVQGIQGTQGIQGLTGNTGSTGITGPTGIQGLQGPMGQQGPVGAVGVGLPGAAGSTGPTGAASHTLQLVATDANTQPVPAASSMVVKWNTVHKNLNNQYDPNTGYFKVQQTGFYLINAAVTPTGSAFLSYVVKNGSNIMILATGTSWTYKMPGYVAPAAASAVLYLQANDLIWLEASTPATNNTMAYMYPTTSHFSIMKVE